MTKVRHHAMATLAEACGDDAEILALSVIRMIAAGYSTGDVACWDMAYDGAERTLGPEPAGKLVASLTTLIRAMRAARSGEWQFMPVSCCRVTGDEAGMLRLLAAARHGEADAVQHAASVVSGSASPRLTMAARTAAAVLDDIAIGLATPKPGRLPTHLH